MGKRRIYNTTLDSELTKGVRILAAQLGKRQDDLLEEAIQDLLKKYIQDLEAPLLGLSEG
jgi:predicted transcriptional regulator